MSSAPLAGGAPAFYPFVTMTGGSGKSGDPRRAERLRTALRDNLKRRKAQAKARARAAGQDTDKSGPPPPKKEGG